ncbi:MAG: FtsH protease activity modulator HflK [Thermoguttaceae bacterium]
MHRAYHPTPPRPKKRLRWWRVLPWLAVAYALTGIYSVQPNEQAVVRRFGRVLSQVSQPGLHFGLPYGIDRVVKVRMQEQKQVGVGMSRLGRSAGGTPDRVAGQTGAGINQWSRALGRQLQPQEAECLTGDNNVILLSANVQYQVEDVRQYLFQTANVAALVENAVAGALCEEICRMEVDGVLTTQRGWIQSEVRRHAQDTLDRYQAGVRVTSVLLDERTGPPQEVADAFRDVTAAREDQQRAINEAHGYAARLQQSAEADADSLLQQAEAFAQQTTLLAGSGAERFRMLQAELAQGRELTVRRLILEAMEEVLPRMKKIVADRESSQAVDLGIVQPEE